jgi:hypothetical protein
MEAANFDDERSRLCDLASSGARVFFTAHAVDEMAADSIARLDVEEMLCTCTVTRVADSKGEESWRAEGEDFDGRVIVAVVVPYESANPPYIKIVTAWVKK